MLPSPAALHQTDHRDLDVHVAFAAADRASVKAFYEAAVAAGATTVVPGSGPSTTRATTGPSSSIRTATTSKRSAIGQGRKPEPSDPYSPQIVERLSGKSLAVCLAGLLAAETGRSARLSWPPVFSASRGETEHFRPVFTTR
jgi:hypothetical protein